MFGKAMWKNLMQQRKQPAVSGRRLLLSSYIHDKLYKAHHSSSICRERERSYHGKRICQMI